MTQCNLDHDRFSYEYLADCLEIGQRVWVEDDEGWPEGSFMSQYEYLYAPLENDTWTSWRSGDSTIPKMVKGRVSRVLLGFCEDDGPPNYEVTFYRGLRKVTEEFSSDDIEYETRY